jgi:hypothetical protein
LPFRATFREVYSNNCIIKLFESSFITTLFQDLLAKDIKLYIKNPSIVNQFAEHFEKKISTLMRQKPGALLQQAYAVYDPYFSSFVMSDVVKDSFTNSVVPHLKESMYSPDYWMYTITVEHMQSMVEQLHEKYGDASISGILATIRETIM